MGDLFSYLGTTGRTDDPDSVTGLTSRNKYLLQASWDLIRKDLTKNGVVFFLLLFDKYPQEQSFFPFRNIPKNELAPNKKFQAHCNSVMYSISSIVDNLNDTELLLSILEKLGKNHKRNLVKAQSFWNAKDTLLEMLENMEFPQDTLQSWNKALDVCFKVIADNV